MLTNDERLERMREVLDRRMHHVSVALEALYHRHNVSAVLRTVDAMGLHRVHLVEGHFKAVRGAARGAERWLELHHHASPADAIEAIRGAGYRVYVADFAEDALIPEQLPVDQPVCLWFGAELVGVSPVAREAADGVVMIPMHGFAQSLNVSVAAALTLRPVAERARALGEAALLAPAEREAIWEAWLEREEARHLRGKAHPED